MAGNICGLIAVLHGLLIVNGQRPVCKDGKQYMHHEDDCTLFYHCASGFPYVKECPLNLVFSTIVKNCVVPGNVYDDCTLGTGSGGTNTGGAGSTGTGGTGTGGTGTDGTGTGTGNRGSGNTGIGGTGTTGNGSSGTTGTGGTGTGGTGTGGTGTGGTGTGGTGTSGTVGTGTGGANRVKIAVRTRVTVNHPQPERIGPPNGTFVRVFGPKSLVADKARSVAVCPAGSVPINCACLNVGTGCDGSLIVGRQCTVFNSATGPGELAYAVCYFDDIDNWTVVNSGLKRQPVARCPSGYELIQCIIYNRYSHVRWIRVLLNKDFNTCVSEQPCVFGAGCNAQAICRKIQ